jgi:hypothetical protein
LKETQTIYSANYCEYIKQDHCIFFLRKPCHEIVHLGEDLNREGGGLDMLPIPISTPGLDNAPYTTCSHWFSKDPDTGIQNIGNYRGQIKDQRKVGCYNQGSQHFTVHLYKYREKGLPMDAALVIGVPPVILINTPGEAPNAATVIDGYPMAQKGKAGVALGAAATASTLGGFIGLFITLAMIPIINKFLMAFSYIPESPYQHPSSRGLPKLWQQKEF